VLGVGDQGDPRSRLALDDWAVAPGTPAVPDLLARYRRAFDALPGGPTVSAPER
jgi:hypothetical protein